MVLERVVSVGDAEVVSPAGAESSRADDGGEIDDVGGEPRQEAVLVDLGPVAFARRRAVIAEAGTLALAVAAERVQPSRAGAAEGQAERGERHEILRRAVTPMMIRHRDRVVLRDEVAVDHLVGITPELRLGVRSGAVRRVAVAVLREQADRPSSQWNPPATIDVERATVARKARPIAVDGQRRRVVLARHVFAEVDAEEWSECPVLEYDVDDAGNRVGAVLRGGAVAEHLESLDCARREGVHVHPARARPLPGAVIMNERGVMAALSIEQHERVIGTQPAHGEWPDDLRRVGNALPREIHRRGELGENLSGLGGALRANHLRREYIDGNRQLIGRGMGGARADDDRRQSISNAAEGEILLDG